MTTPNDVHDKITDAFIDERPVDLSLHRRKKVPQPGGGFKWVADITLAPQRCRLVYRSNGSDATQVTLPGGRVVNIEAVLVFTFEGDVQVLDQFDLNGERWEVARVVSTYDLTAEVYRYA